MLSLTAGPVPMGSLSSGPAILDLLPASPGHQPASLSFSLFATFPAPLHVVPSSGDPIALGAATETWCDTCQVVSPLFNHQQYGNIVWYVVCHQNVCQNCNCVEEDFCSNCETCTDCCECVICSSCEDFASDGNICDSCNACDSCCSCMFCDYGYHKVSAYSWCNGCDQCEDHCQCETDDDDYCSCSDCRNNGIGSVPGWVTRNDVMPTNVPESAKHELKEDGTKHIDPVQMMADFYIADYVSAVISQGFRFGTSFNNGTKNAHILRIDAMTLQSYVVDRCDRIFRDYVLMAIGGEVRHHRKVSGNFPSGRSSAWDYFVAMANLNGRVNLISDCVDLFSDGSWSSGYGGEKWAVCARTLLMRETGRIDARTFVDRVFSLQHNGGSLLNKVSWSSDCSGRTVDWCQTVGNAHAADEIGFATLLEVCSEDARTLLETLLAQHGNIVPARDKDRLTWSLSNLSGATYSHASDAF